MRSPLPSAALSLSLLLIAATSLRAADPEHGPSPDTAPPAAAHPKHVATELEERMDEMGRAFKKLRRQASHAEQNASSVELVSQLHASAEKASKLTPARAADVPDAERPKFIADYQTEMKDLLAQLAQLGDAFKANDNALAEKILKDIGAMQKKDHKAFQRPES